VDERVARIENVIDHEYVAALDVGQHLGVDRQRAAFGAFITAGLEHADAERHV
jgi:hypothetical protein